MRDCGCGLKFSGGGKTRKGSKSGKVRKSKKTRRSIRKHKKGGH
jgi:hypothetical protein